jgi:hypothetical protein
MAQLEFPFPDIAAQDYDAIRGRVTTDFPDTYDKWLKLINDRRFEHERRGFVTRKIQIDPAEFTRYCGARGYPHDLKRLMDFTAEKAAGNRY